MVDRYRVAVTPWPRRSALKELLVVSVVMQPVETRGEPKVSELDMAAAVKEDVIRFDITGSPVLVLEPPKRR